MAVPGHAFRRTDATRVRQDCGNRPMQARHPISQETSTMNTTASPTARTTAPAGQNVRAGAREYLSFKLGAEEYGIDILKVQEIRGYEAPTRIANAPSHIKGVVNLRGVIVPIVDMRVRFALDDVQYNGFTVTIILNIVGRTVGMVVDSVSDVLELTPDHIKAAPQFNGAIDAGFITGLGTVTQGDTERMLILVDIESLLSGPEMGLMDQVLH
jgi:purine-binding chemotaxis protein CheW